MKRKTAKKSRKRFSSIKEETAHYDAILIEDLKDQFRFVTEKVGSMEESLRNQMVQDKVELKQDIFDNRHAFEMKLESLRNQMVQNTVELKTELKQEIYDNRHVLEVKVDKVLDRLDRHDEDIVSLKQKAAVS